MLNEKFNKKLSMFYHPLFQDLINTWTSSFISNKSNVDMITFIEFNLRIQKAIIPLFDFQNSLHSALADWYKEINDLTSINEKSYHSATNFLPNINPNFNRVITLLDSFPFALSAPREDYFSFFKANKTHVALKYVQMKLSFNGFSKFLFDLCISWCENLDIELFLFFLIGVLLQITEGPTIQSSTLAKTEDIMPLSQQFLNQLKTFKVHYERYKKQDLSSFQSWYEWNYLPPRLKEIVERLMDSIRSIYAPSNTTRLDDLYYIFQKSIQNDDTNKLDIKENLNNHIKLYDKLLANEANNTLNSQEANNNLKYQHDGSINPIKSINGNMKLHPMNDNGQLGRVMHTEDIDIQIDTEKLGNKHSKLVKKVYMPIIGKAIPKHHQMNKIKHANSSQQNYTGYLENIASNESQIHDDDQRPTGLYPIWEKGELSDTISTQTLADFDQLHQIEDLPDQNAIKTLYNNNNNALPANTYQGRDEVGSGPGGSVYTTNNSSEIKVIDEMDSGSLLIHPKEVASKSIITTDSCSNTHIVDSNSHTHIPDSTSNIHLQSKSGISTPAHQTIFGNSSQDLFTENNSTNKSCNTDYHPNHIHIIRDYLNDINDLNNNNTNLNTNAYPLSDFTPTDRAYSKSKLRNLTKDYGQSNPFRKDTKLTGTYRSHSHNHHRSFDNNTLYRIDDPYSRGDQNNLPVTKYDLPFYNRKIILTSTAKQNILNLSPRIDRSTIFKTEHQEHPKLAIIIENDIKESESLESKKVTITPGNWKKRVGTMNYGNLIDGNIYTLSQKSPRLKYDFSLYESLFPDGLSRFDIQNVKTEKEYLQKINEIKRVYNDQYKSEYLKSYNLQKEYQSTRHEMGGAIYDHERDEFLRRVENLWEKKQINLQKKKNIGLVSPMKALKTLDKPKFKKAFLTKESKSFYKEIILGTKEESLA